MFKLKFKVLGVGSAGAKIVTAMAGGFKPNSDVSADFMVCDNDREKLKPLVNKGADLMRLRANDKLTDSETDAIRDYFSGADIAFICAGMGGITGSDIAPIAAKIAKESGVLTIGITTMPFSFERGNKKQNAETGFVNLKESCDTVFTALSFSQDTPLPDLTINEFFEMVDNRYLEIVQSFADMLDPGKAVNIDFSDFQELLTDTGETSYYTFDSYGDNRITEIVNAATNIFPQNIKKLIIHALFSRDTLLCEIDELLGRLINPLGNNIEVAVSGDFSGDNETETITLSAIVI